MLRSLASIVAGYLVTSLFIAAFSSVVNGLFHLQAGTPTAATLDVIIRFLAAITGGYTAARIAVHKETIHALVLGGILTVIAIIFPPTGAPMIFQILNMLLFLPGTWIGGFLRQARHRSEEEGATPGASI